MAAADNWGVIGFALKPLPSGPATLFGVTASSYTLSRVTAATKKTFAQVAMPATFAAVVAGIATVPAVTHYGQAAVSLTFGETTQATRRAFGAHRHPAHLHQGRPGQPKNLRGHRDPAHVPRDAQPASTANVRPDRRPVHSRVRHRRDRHHRRGYLLRPGRGPVHLRGSHSGRRKTFSTLAAPFTFIKAVQAQRRTTGATATPFTFAAVTSSRKQYARLAAPFIFGELTQARKHTYGIVTRPFTVTIVTQGVGFTGAATYFGATAVQLTFGEVTAGRKRTFAQTAAPFTFSKAVQGQRRTFAQVAAPFTFARATQAQRRTTGQIARPFTVAFVTAGFSTVGIVTHYGLLTMPLAFTKTTAGRKKTFALVTAPYTFGEQTQARRKTFGATATPLTMAFATSGLAILAPILNYAQDIRWGAIQADAVYVGDELVWTPAETREGGTMTELAETPAAVEIRSGQGYEVAEVNFPKRIVTVVAMPYERPTEVPYGNRIVTEVVSRDAFNGIEKRAGTDPGQPRPHLGQSRAANSSACTRPGKKDWSPRSGCSRPSSATKP